MKLWRSLRFWLYWPGLLAFFHGTRRVRVLVRFGNEILLVQDRPTVWPDDGKWTTPGGGVDGDETVQETAAREIHEELGIIANPNNYRLLGEGKVSAYGLAYYGYFFLLDIPSKPTLELQKSEITRGVWYTLQETQSIRLRPDASQALQLLANSQYATSTSMNVPEPVK